MSKTDPNQLLDPAAISRAERRIGQLTKEAGTPQFSPMKTMTLNISLTPYYRAIIRRFLKAGRYESDSEVVGAALQRIEETESDPGAYRPGSLRRLYTPAAIAKNANSTKVSTLRVDHVEKT